jgi:hypothetical protein
MHLNEIQNMKLEQWNLRYFNEICAVALYCDVYTHC